MCRFAQVGMPLFGVAAATATAVGVDQVVTASTIATAASFIDSPFPG
jgi:hypothetical protein